MSVLNKALTVILSYLLSFGFSTIVIVYILNVPGLLTGQQKLVDEYYRKNFVSSTILDLFLIFAYIAVGHSVIHYGSINNLGIRFLVMAIMTMIISGIFYIIIGGRPLNESSFFSRWFHSAKEYAVMYDMIIVPVTYISTVFLITHHKLMK